MSKIARRWMFGLAMLFTVAAAGVYTPTADAQVVVRVGPHRRHYHHRHAYYRHGRRYYR